MFLTHQANGDSASSSRGGIVATSDNIDEKAAPVSDDLQVPAKRAAKHVQDVQKSAAKRNVAIGVGVLVVIAVAVFLLPKAGSGTPKVVAPTAPVVAATSTAGLPFGADTWVMMTLSDGQVYFGRLVEPAPGFVTLWDVYYPNSAAASQNQSATVLTKVGTELHRPRPYIVVNRGAIVAVQGLAPKSKVLAAITAGATGQSTRPDSKSKAPLSAVFLTGGRVVFGTVSVSDEWFSIGDPHYLARKSGNRAANAPIRSLNDLQLVPEADARIGLSNKMFVPLSEVLFYEALDPASPVVQALSASAVSTPALEP